MKIALPASGNQIDPHFGHCEKFIIFSLDEDKKIVAREELVPPAGCGCKTNIIPELAALGVSVMLAGNMGGGAVSMLQQNGIEVIRGCNGDVDEVVAAWLAGSVDDSGVGCAGHDGCGSH